MQYTYGNVEQDLDQELDKASVGLHAPQRLARWAAFIGLALMLMVTGAFTVAKATPPPPAQGAPPPTGAAEADDVEARSEALLQANLSKATQLSLFGNLLGRPSYGRPAGRYGYGQPLAGRPIGGYGQPARPAYGMSSARGSCCAGVPGGSCCIDYPPVFCGMGQKCNMEQCVMAAPGAGRPMGSGTGMGGSYGSGYGGQGGYGGQRPGPLSGYGGQRP